MSLGLAKNTLGYEYGGKGPLELILAHWVHKGFQDQGLNGP